MSKLLPEITRKMKIKKKSSLIFLNNEGIIPNNTNNRMHQPFTPHDKTKPTLVNFGMNNERLIEFSSLTTSNPQKVVAIPKEASNQPEAPNGQAANPASFHFVKTCSINRTNCQKPTPKEQEANPKRASSQQLIATLVLIMILTSSCVKHPQLLNFRNQSEFVPLQGHEIANQLRIKIQTDDVLFIMVRALDQETAEPFNLFGGTGMQMMQQMANNNPSLSGYLVDSEGNIDIPVLGRLNVRGKTVEETKVMIGDKLKPYLNDPVVLIRFLNFRFTVLGEVKATISVPGERMTILEALGQAGDLTPYSNREKIMVIRENNGAREFGYINIHSPEVFQSPYFYLQQNDIVYVEPIPEAVATVRDPIQEALPILSGVLSIIAVVVAFAR
jgi:polysaccharide biosynthesis/export protein